MSFADVPVFEAVIVPHRSLTRRGVLVVVGALMVLSAAVGIRFWMMGAWPVVAFSAIEIPALVVLLAINLRRARESELIMLDACALTVIHTDPAGRRKQASLPSGWLRVDLDAAGGSAHVMLRSQGRGFEVGAFLHEPDKRLLFEALSDALHRLRNPRFDNPQLRNC